MRHTSDRALRVAGLIKRELADLLCDRVSDPAVSGAVISDVEVNRDLSCAKVYLLSTENQAEILVGFERTKGFLRTLLGERLQLRAVPRLEFLTDETQLRAERIERLLAEEKQRG